MPFLPICERIDRPNTKKKSFQVPSERWSSATRWFSRWKPEANRSVETVFLYIWK